MKLIALTGRLKNLNR